MEESQLLVHSQHLGHQAEHPYRDYWDSIQGDAEETLHLAEYSWCARESLIFELLLRGGLFGFGR